MPSHLKALVVILFLATVVFVFAKAPACEVASNERDFARRRNLWFALTFTAFLAHNFWIYIVVSAALLLFAQHREPNKLAMYFFVAFALPAILVEIGGIGSVNRLIEIDYYRLLSLTVLLPAYLVIRKLPDTERFGRRLPDKLIAGYLILSFVLILPNSTFTNSLRQGVFYAFTDVFLLYYVASRGVRDLKGFRDALMSFIIGAMVLSAIGVFEFVMRWLLYAALDDALQTQKVYGRYLMRGESLRAMGTAGHAIPMGYAMAVAMGLYLYLRRLVPSATLWGLGWLLLAAGLVATLSRGPWVGAAAMLLLFVAAGPAAASSLLKLGLLGIVCVPLLLFSPMGEKVIDHLPFVGTVNADTVEYRRMLLQISIQTILDNPLVGNPNFYESYAMRQLIQGQGIIDLVNSYVAVGLSYGLIGLALFVSFFLAVLFGIRKSMNSLVDKNDERHVLGRCLLATLVGIMLIIFTTSSMSVVPLIYWTVAGLGVAYARVLVPEKGSTPGVSSPARPRPAVLQHRNAAGSRSPGSLGPG